MKLIIAGSRGFNDVVTFARVLEFITKDMGNDITVISGTARGADQLGEQWAKGRGLPVIRMPADWDRYGRKAGFLRNEEMAKIATHCVCFWDGKSPGTKHMIDIAFHYRVPLIIVDPDGGMR